MVLGVHSLGCYLSYPRNPIFSTLLNAKIQGSDAIQQCINAANRITRRNFQGIGITNIGSGYKCTADVRADLRYNTYGKASNCGSDGLGAQNTNGTAVFMFTGEYLTLSRILLKH